MFLDFKKYKDCFIAASVYVLDKTKEFDIYSKPGELANTKISQYKKTIEDFDNPLNNYIGGNSNIKGNRYFSNSVALFEHNIVCIDCDINVNEVKEKHKNVCECLERIQNDSMFYSLSKSGHITFFVRVSDNVKDIFKHNDTSIGNSNHIEILHKAKNLKMCYALNDRTIREGKDNYYSLVKRNGLEHTTSDDLIIELSDLLDSFHIETEMKEYDIQNKGHLKEFGWDFKKIIMSYNNPPITAESPYNALIKFAGYAKGGFMSEETFNEVIDWVKDNHNPKIRDSKFFLPGNAYDQYVKGAVQSIFKPSNVKKDDNTTTEIQVNPVKDSRFVTYGKNVADKYKKSYVMLESKGYTVYELEQSSAAHVLANLGVKRTIVDAEKPFIIVNIDPAPFKEKLDEPKLYKDILNTDDNLVQRINKFYPNVTDETLIINNYRYCNFAARYGRHRYNRGEISSNIMYSDLSEGLRNTLNNIFDTHLYPDAVRKNLMLIAGHFVYNRRPRSTLCVVGAGGTGKDTIFGLLSNIYSSGFQKINNSKWDSAETEKATVLYRDELKFDNYEDYNKFKATSEALDRVSEKKCISPTLIDTAKQWSVATAQNVQNILWVVNSESEVNAFARRLNIVWNKEAKMLATADFATIDKTNEKEFIDASAELALFFYSLVLRYPSEEDFYKECDKIELEIVNAMIDFVKSNRDKSPKEIFADFIDEVRSGNINLLVSILNDYSDIEITDTTKIMWNHLKDVMNKAFFSESGKNMDNNSKKLLRECIWSNKEWDDTNTKRNKFTINELRASSLNNLNGF